MEVRRFSADLKTRIPGGHRGLWGVPIQFDRATLVTQDLDALAQQLNGLPILLDRPTRVVALYLDAHGAMAEHPAPVPVLFLVSGGLGFVRVGGPDGETRAVTAGDAVLWPAGVDHAVWTEEEPLAAIVVDGPPERGAHER
jgi:mannose-6-phosphate isomerase-like protein (cupin superfamily)